MADWQAAFLSKVILDRETVTAVNAGITAAFFRTPEYQQVYEFIIGHWNKYGEPADEQVVKSAYPSMKWKPQKQPLEYLIDQMRRDRQLVIYTEALNEAVPLVSAEDPVALAEILQNGLMNARLETSAARDFNYVTGTSELEDRIWERMEDPGYLRGISTGFKGIDYVTGGFQPEQFIVLLGTPKSFKSATLLYMARAVHRQAKLALFIGYEMSNVEQSDRLVSLDSEVSLTKIMHGTLNHKDFEKVQQALKVVEQMRPFVFSTDITAATTLSGIQAKVMEYQPDVLFIDGAYLMQPEGDRVEPGSPQAMTQISRGCKRMAQSLKIPVVITTQASLPRSKGGLSLGSAMYTQAWGQDCDVLLGVERQKEEGEIEDELKGQAMVKFRVLESRSGPRKDVMLEWNWSRGMVSEIDPEDVKKALDKRSTKGKRAMYGDSEDEDGDD